MTIQNSHWWSQPRDVRHPVGSTRVNLSKNKLSPPKLIPRVRIVNSHWWNPSFSSSTVISSIVTCSRKMRRENSILYRDMFNTWHACQLWHAITLKVARELMPYFLNMLQCNFKYRYIVYCCSVVLIKLVSDFYSFCSSILIHDVRGVKLRYLLARPQTSFASATKYDLL